jgi:hypothetical protein
MGDIFRRNSFNLGLHVVQCPEAVADARDNDEFEFDPDHALDQERDAGQELHAGAALDQGRRDSAERRHLCRRPPRVPRVGRHAPRRRLPGCGTADDDDVDRTESSGRIASTRA